MFRKALMSFSVLFLSIPVVLAVPQTKTTISQLTAAQIVDKNIAAKGGLQAWRALQTISFTGKMDAGGKNNTQLPFVMKMKRDRKMRLELEFEGKTAVQVYDGVNGWKLRPFLGRNDVEPYTPEEVKSASTEADLDGPLVDYTAKGTKAELEGIEQVEGHDAYKLKLTMKGDQTKHIWVNSQSFLEVKLEGTPRRLDGKIHLVAIYLRDYKSVSGLMIPHLVETAVDGVKATHKMTIATVVVNPNLEDAQFAKPNPQGR